MTNHYSGGSGLGLYSTKMSESDTDQELSGAGGKHEATTSGGVREPAVESQATQSGFTIMQELATAIAEVVRQSAAEETTNSRVLEKHVAPRQPRPFSAGQNFRTWLAQYHQYASLVNIPQGKRKAFLLTLLDCPAYKAVELLRLPEDLSYEDFVEKLKNRFDSTKSPGDYKLCLKARQQKPNEDLETYADNLLELAENAYPDADFSFKEELAKDRFLEGVRCGDGLREQLFISQPQTLSEAVRLTRQLESARAAARSSNGEKPRSAMDSGVQKSREQINVVNEASKGGEMEELKSLVMQLHAKIDSLEKQQASMRPRDMGKPRDMSKIKCFSCQQHGHYARACPNKQGGNE